MNQLAPIAHGDIMESVLLKGDLAKLTADERVRYYGEVCRSVGLNPLTKPFDFITLNGKLQLYALRTCADQLRKINGVSLEIVNRIIADDVLTIHVRARLPDGRTDEDLGAVAYPSTLKGEARANAELKCITKAKRRATLSICGLGWLDETEVEDIPSSAKAPTARARIAAIASIPDADKRADEAEQMAEAWIDRQGKNLGNALRAHQPTPEHDADGVVWDADGERPATQDDLDGAETDSERLARLDGELAAAAKLGTVALKGAWGLIPHADRKALEVAKDRRHKITAIEADKAKAEVGK